MNTDLLEMIYPTRNGECYFTITSRAGQFKAMMTAEALMKAAEK